MSEPRELLDGHRERAQQLIDILRALIDDLEAELEDDTLSRNTALSVTTSANILSANVARMELLLWLERESARKPMT